MFLIVNEILIKTDESHSCNRRFDFKAGGNAFSSNNVYAGVREKNLFVCRLERAAVAARTAATRAQADKDPRAGQYNARASVRRWTRLRFSRPPRGTVIGLVGENALICTGNGGAETYADYDYVHVVVIIIIINSAVISRDTPVVRGQLDNLGFCIRRLEQVTHAAQRAK